MEPYLGQLMLVGYGFAQRGFAICEGQLLAISQNTALFSLLGTTYGGNGQTTFALPDLRGRTPIGIGTGPGLSTFSWGEKGGSPQNTLITNNLPAHNHGLNVSSANATQDVATTGTSIATHGTQNGRAFTTSQAFNTATPNVTMNTASVGSTGSSIPVNNMQPYLAMYWVIALQGIYPSRN